MCFTFLRSQNMAQACTVSHAENKRSLPAWMLKASSGNEVPKTEDRNRQALESNVKIGTVDPTKPIKRNTGRRLKSVDSEGASELVVLQRCQGKENARRKSKGAVQDGVEEIRDVPIKKGRKVSEGAAPKNNRKRKLENIKSETSSPVSVDDDVELTVEDLLSIAEEYVNADKQKQHEFEAMKTNRRKENFSCPTEAGTGVSAVNDPPKKGLLQCTTATRNTRSSEHTEENKSHQELQCSSRCETTEDVAQDMLNLFLGPLWSKPAGFSKNSEPVESITRNTNNHMPEETDWHSEVQTQGEPVKKSMLTATINHVPKKKGCCSEVPPQGEPMKKSMLTATINHVPEKKDCCSEVPPQGEPVKKSMLTATINHVPKKKGCCSEVPPQGEPMKKSMLTATINHVPEKKDWRSELPKLGEPVITKKKSSLRDKVALFL